jgi:hypothetical protein
VRTVQLDWQQATALAAGLTVAGLAARRSAVGFASRSAPYIGECAVVAALYAFWQLAATLSVIGSGAGAFSRARDILRVEHRAHLPSELDLQRVILGHPGLEQACNLYYATMHFLGLGAFLVWLFSRHRSSYGRIRVVIVALTLSCLAIQLVPVAPPRLLPDKGFTDVAAKFGQSVYQIRGITADQLSAMPSVHVGWAVLIAWGVITVSRSRWRWLIIAHPVITVFVVIATANHFWADGIVAVTLLLLAISLTSLGYRLAPQHRLRRPDGPLVTNDHAVT